MPVRNFAVAATNAGQETEIVPPGAILNGITILEVPAGVRPTVRLGNNPAIGPFINPQPIDFGSDVDMADVSEGVYMASSVGVVGAVIRGFVSYRSSNAGASAGQGIPPVGQASATLVTTKPVY